MATLGYLKEKKRFVADPRRAKKRDRIHMRGATARQSRFRDLYEDAWPTTDGQSSIVNSRYRCTYLWIPDSDLQLAAESTWTFITALSVKMVYHRLNSKLGKYPEVVVDTENRNKVQK